MNKAKLWCVSRGANAAGLETLRDSGGRVAVPAGRYRARVRALGLGDPLFAGTTDKVAAAFVIGACEVHLAQKMTSATDADRFVGKVDADVEVEAGRPVKLGASLVIDRGKSPEALRELTRAIEKRLPDGTLAAIVEGALAGSAGGVAVAVAAGVVCGALDQVAGSVFGEHTLLTGEGTLSGADGSADGGALTLCLLLPPPHGATTGADYAVEPGTFRLHETRRDRPASGDSPRHPGWRACKDVPYVVLTLEPLA